MIKLNGAMTYFSDVQIDGRSVIIGYCINTTFYDRGHVSNALPSLRGNALPRHERGHKMLYLFNNLIIIYPYKINRNHAIRDRNSFNYIYIYEKSKPNHIWPPCEHCSFVVA